MPERSVREETEYPMKMERYFHRFFYSLNSYTSEEKEGNEPVCESQSEYSSRETETFPFDFD